MSNKTIVEIYSDGACKGNPGVGGWGALLRYGQQEKELFGGEADTTNNRMELLSVIIALESLKKENEQVTIYSDSKYVIEYVEKKCGKSGVPGIQNTQKTDFWR